ncbi:MAG TPA: M14 family zinc carboxypeptidase [Vicinamibacterales bacterium]|nr:M14 family zinc carboxypeptidase [Vicinamibacterales bacterium]
MRRLVIGLVALVLAPLAGLAQQSVLEYRDPQQTQDLEFAKLVREWTTKPEFMSPLVDHLPLAPGVPTPKEILGYHIGQPKTLTYYADILRYYRALDAASDRVSIESIGKTDEGREMVVVYISDEASIRDLQKHRDGYMTLADPRKLSEADIRKVIAETKPMYQLMGGLHSGETGPSEMLMELAYRLAVETSPIVSQIRDNVIVAITPAADADGRDRYVDWYYRHLIHYDTQTGRPGGPPYWGKYVFHDNNRDINFSQVSMRNLLEWYMRTKPPIMHDLHESIPFLYTYSGQAPQNPNLDPILFAELPMFANFEMAQMIKYGMPGVWTHGFMDGWSPGYLGSMSYNHNGLMRMYETFGNGGANTMKRTIGGGRGGGEGGGGRGGGQASREWYRPLPPYSEVEWSMRNNTNYMQTGVLSGLQFAASFPKIILENFYKKTMNSIEGGKTTAPHAFIIPGGQRDETRVALLVNLLRLQGIEVGLASSPIKIKDKTYPAGSYVIKRDQPYGRLAKILLEKQDYPDPALRTYDDSGWTMGHMLHTEVITVDDSSILDVPVALVSSAALKGRVGGRGGAALAVAHFGSNHMITLRHRLKDMPVKTAAKPFKAGGVEYPAGSFVIPADGGDLAKARAEIEALGLTARALDRMPDVAMQDADLPRIAMYSTWTSTQEVGWVRHAFDQFEIPFDLIYKERIADGNLRRDYDVIVIPSQAGSGRAFVERAPATGKPLAYTKTDEFKFLGEYGSSEDIRGGFGLEGVLEFQKFVDAGGVLITLGSASYFPADFGLAPGLTATRQSSTFYAPRPIVNAEVMRAEHPIFYGYDKKVLPTKYTNGPLLTAGAPGTVLLRYPGGDDNVLSGLMRGANEIRNRAAIVEVPNGKGRVIVYATNPVYRWQNHGEFNMLFNALINWNDLATAPSPSAPSSASR